MNPIKKKHGTNGKHSPEDNAHSPPQPANSHQTSPESAAVQKPSKPVRLLGEEDPATTQRDTHDPEKTTIKIGHRAPIGAQNTVRQDKGKRPVREGDAARFAIAERMRDIVLKLKGVDMSEEKAEEIHDCLDVVDAILDGRWMWEDARDMIRME